jgi:hypothetical protein
MNSLSGPVQAQGNNNVTPNAFSRQAQAGLAGGAFGGANAAANQVAQNSEQNFSFRVTGTNHTMNQVVVFTGQFQALVNQQNAQNNTLQPTSARIEGKASLGDTNNELKIEAQQVGP